MTDERVGMFQYVFSGESEYAACNLSGSGATQLS